MVVVTLSPRRHLAFRSGRLAPALALLIAAPLAFGCHDSPSESRVEVRVETLAKATLTPRSGPEVRTVVRDQASWAATWQQLWGDAAPPRPAVDFGRDMVVVATASLSCFGEVEIEDVDRDRGRLVVQIADSGPAPLCVCFAPEYVFHVVRATRVDGPATFAVRTTPPRCD
jgi:hypothetical protein